MKIVKYDNRYIALLNDAANKIYWSGNARPVIKSFDIVNGSSIEDISRIAQYVTLNGGTTSRVSQLISTEKHVFSRISEGVSLVQYNGTGAIADANTMMLYRLDESGNFASGTADVMSNMSLSKVGSVGSVSGVVDGAANFAGSTGYFIKTQASLPSWFTTLESTLRNGPWTIELWIKLDDMATSVSQFITPIGLGKSSSPNNNIVWSLTIDRNTGQLLYQWTTAQNVYGTIAWNGFVPDNTWTHVAMRRTGMNVDLFINGQQVDSQTMPSTPQQQTTLLNFVIGINWNLNYGWLKGNLDDIRISNVARTNDEIYYSWRNS